MIYCHFVGPVKLIYINSHVLLGLLNNRPKKKKTKPKRVVLDPMYRENESKKNRYTSVDEQATGYRPKKKNEGKEEHPDS